jgi:hypothetical protein
MVLLIQCISLSCDKSAIDSTVEPFSFYLFLICINTIGINLKARQNKEILAARKVKYCTALKNVLRKDTISLFPEFFRYRCIQDIDIF